MALVYSKTFLKTVSSFIRTRCCPVLWKRPTDYAISKIKKKQQQNGEVVGEVPDLLADRASASKMLIAIFHLFDLILAGINTDNWESYANDHANYSKKRWNTFRGRRFFLRMF